MKIYEIARLAGVSIATVSRVVNQKRVGGQIRDKVLAVIQKYHYQPDPFARYLARRKNGKT